jgi:hypothetical protein
MTLQVSFGQGGTSSQWYLPGTDPMALPKPQPGLPAPDALSNGPHSPAWDDTPLFGGLVEAETIGGTDHSFDVTGGWNSVKNAFAQSDQAEHLRFDGFVHVDIAVGSAEPGDGSVIEVAGAKRGNIVTGDGDDIITVEMLSNEAQWNNEFRIVAGGGDDLVVLRGLDRAEELAGGDTTYAGFAGTRGSWNSSGSNTSTFTDLGAGHDRFNGHGSTDTVTGGAGDDQASGGAGCDTWVLSGDQNGYAFAFANGSWLITDTDLADGNDGRDEITGFETVRFGDGSSITLVSPQQGLVLWNRLGSAPEVTNSEVGPGGTLVGGSFVPGVFGQAWRAEPGDSTRYDTDPTELKGLSFPSSVINAASGTIEFWARLEGYTGWVGDNGPGLVLTAPVSPVSAAPAGSHYIGFGSNDGAGNGGLVGAVGDANTTGTDVFWADQTFEGILGGDADGWHHYALSWDASGFATLGQPDREVMLFVDGNLVSTHWEEAVLRSFGPPLVYGTGALTEPYGEQLVLAFNSGPANAWPEGSAVEFDNLKVWDLARTDFCDRFVEDSGFGLIG